LKEEEIAILLNENIQLKDENEKLTELNNLNCEMI
jgi:hypothetical protein